MSQLLRVAAAAAVAALSVAAALIVAGSATGEPQFERCKGLVRGAPWTEGIRGSGGPIGGTRYAVWIGSFGPSCTTAKSRAARFSRLRTPRALRRASFSGYKCRISPLSSVSAKLVSVRPRTALGGCWTKVNQPVSPYFYWQPRR